LPDQRQGLHPGAVSEFHFIPPCSPIRATAVPSGDGWVHEVKFDGYRVQAHKVRSRVAIFSRNGHNFSERFLAIAQELRELPAETAVLDGEIVVNDVDGRPNFARLHARPSCSCIQSPISQMPIRSMMASNRHAAHFS
jgi:ATP-dependent DNA ligase